MTPSDVTSVIIPVLNGERFVRQAIESALAQLGKDDEIIIIDNGSTDASMAKVAKVDDPRVMVLQEKKPGPSAARNTGLRQARGAYVAFLDCDDLWPANRHANLLALLQSDPTIDVAYGRIRMLYEGEPDSRYAHLDGMLTEVVFLHPFLFRRSLLDRVGPLNEDMMSGEDTDLLLRIKELGGRFAAHDSDAIFYRRHDSNMTLRRETIKNGILGTLAEKLKRKRQE